MQESSTKTSFRQRVIIFIIALLLLISFVALYAGIVLGGNKSTSNNLNIDQNKVAELKSAYDEAESAAAPVKTALSDQYFETLKSYKSEVKAFNSESANSSEVVATDLAAGSGRELTAGDTDYYAYYIGWCADEKIFDSSFDNSDNPTSLKDPLAVGNMSLITGWTEGVVGMKLGGVRELTIPSAKAYASEDKGCGENAPIKFVVLAFTPSDEQKSLLETATLASNRYNFYSSYGMDYDEYMSQLEQATTPTSETDSTEAGTTESDASETTE